jgi:hypothetical protein
MSLQDPNDGTKSVATIDVDAYDAILVAGGQAPMFAFDSASTLHTKFVEFSRQTDFYSLLAVTMRSPEIPESATCTATRTDRAIAANLARIKPAFTVLWSQHESQGAYRSDGARSLPGHG